MKIKILIATIAGLGAAGGPAAAQTVIGASTISSPSGSFNSSLGNIINQSGLSSTYVSGSTDYATFVATTTTNGAAQFGGFTNSPGLPQIITLGFSTATTIDAVAFFSLSSIGAVTDFELYADNDSDFSNGTSSLLGRFNPLADILSAQSFSFGPVTTNFVQLRALNTAGGTDRFPGIGELAFRSASIAAAVPEPATWAMMIGGFGLIGGTMRRRRSHAVA